MKTLALLLVTVLVACGSNVAGVDNLCIEGVYLNDNFYRPREELVTASAVSDATYREIVRYDSECLDQGEIAEHVDAESNFLPVGTELHTVNGYDPQERLAYWDTDAEGWRLLIPENG